jgi:hypothetical protein
MKSRTKLAAGAIAAIAVAGVGAGVAVAGDSEKPLKGADYKRATAAALDHTGQGVVTETETGDDGAAYGVEVRLDDGSQVEVQIDRDFNVTGTETDDDGGERAGEDDD